MSENLKPCPFCRGQAHIVWQDTLNEWYVVCNKCGVTTDFYIEHTKAIEAWNRRAE